MAIKIVKPTGPARRHYQVADYSQLSRVAPYKALLRSQKNAAGRNAFGRITMRHQGGGEKQQYRMVEFGQQFLNQIGRVETIEYDPNRTSFICKVVFKNGARAYMIAPQGVKVGDPIEIALKTSVRPGNRMQLKNIPVGTQVHNIEVMPGQRGKIARSAGSYATLMAIEGKYAHLKMPSGEIRKVLCEGFASIGQVSNIEHRAVKLGKAGRSRHMGIRPTVRGKVMNPRDHPYGGGEGRTTRGTKRPKDKWGNITGGHKTRNRSKWSNAFIVSRRPTGKKK